MVLLKKPRKSLYYVYLYKTIPLRNYLKIMDNPTTDVRQDIFEKIYYLSLK